MKIPSSTVQVSAKLHTQSSVEHPQLGTVSVVSDLALDESFINLEGPPVKNWYDLEDGAIEALMHLGVQEIQGSKSLVKHLKQYGVTPADDVRNAICEHAKTTLDQVAQSGKIEGTVDVQLEPTGEISELTFLISEGQAQRVRVTPTKAILESYRNNAIHTMEYEVAQGELDIFSFQETLLMKTP